MTVRELRQMLTNVEDQDMTIRQLRDILFDVEDQDEKLEDTAVARMTSEFSTCYYYEIEGESGVRNFPATTRKSQFFGEVSECIAMSDCSGEEVTKIVYKGVQYWYDGWKPGMLFTYHGEDGGTFEGCYPRLDH